MVAGIVGTSLGGLLAPFGALLFAAEDSTCQCAESFGPGGGGCSCGGDDGVKAGAVAMIAGGIALVGVGIPLMIVGARRTKPEPPATPAAPPGAPPAAPRAAAALVVGPASGALRVQF